MNERLQALQAAGVSIWLDDLSRERLHSGDLQQLVDQMCVSGVTTNPTIFANALAAGEAYADQVAELRDQGLDPDTAVFDITTTDVRHACDVLRPLYDRTDGRDGWVSIEVEPGLARKTAETVDMAQQLAASVNRPNVMIKIPATVEGLPAITAVIAAGISVNVTLIFSLERYRGVMDAYLAGLEQAREAGHQLSQIRSVASFFVSRVDTEIDARLGPDHPLRGQVAVANARLAYEAFEESVGSERFAALAAAGANPQRPLWASTGVKDPAYPATMYVDELIAPDTVNTLPEATLRAFSTHGTVQDDTVRPNYDQAHVVFDQLNAAGVSYAEVVKQLEDEGLAKFDASWDELVATVSALLGRN